MKAKKSEKSKNNNILKHFTIATVDAVGDALLNITTEDLINSIYLKSDDTDVQYLIREYEKQLILSKIDPDRFAKGLHQFFMTMADYIKSNKIYKKFFKLDYIQYVAMCKHNTNDNILVGYKDIIVQQYAYLAGTTKKVVCGLDKNDKLLTVDEVGKWLTEINIDIYSVAKESKSLKVQLGGDAMVIKIFKKHGYKVRSLEECLDIIANDQVTTNMLDFMAYFITERTMQILPRPYRKPTDLVNANPAFLRTDYTQDLIKEKLTQRQIMLPPEGITAKLKNCGEVTEIYLIEVIEDDTVILLWKMRFSDNTFTSGCYDTENEIFYDMYKESLASDYTHIPIENIILQNYMNITCTLTKDERQELVWFKEVKDMVKLNESNGLKPIVYYEIKEHNAKFKGEVVNRHFDRSKYVAELMNIQPYLRRLPIGANVGEEAAKVAKNLGINLPKGYTLVRGFSKQVYKNGVYTQ